MRTNLTFKKFVAFVFLETFQWCNPSIMNVLIIPCQNINFEKEHIKKSHTSGVTRI